MTIEEFIDGSLKDAWIELIYLDTDEQQWKTVRGEFMSIDGSLAGPTVLIKNFRGEMTRYILRDMYKVRRIAPPYF